MKCKVEYVLVFLQHCYVAYTINEQCTRFTFFIRSVRLDITPNLSLGTMVSEGDENKYLFVLFFMTAKVMYVMDVSLISYLYSGGRPSLPHAVMVQKWSSNDKSSVSN